MGSNEPVEHWAGPESLDPTPVWKQYLVVIFLAVTIFAFAGVYAYAALLPDLVTPPAAIPGRIVLRASDHPPGTTKRVALGAEAFYVSNVGREPVAVRARWSPAVGGDPRCEVTLVADDPRRDPASAEGVFLDSCTRSVFGATGAILTGSAPRGLDRYLVSRKGDRLIVNTDHLIQGKP